MKRQSYQVGVTTMHRPWSSPSSSKAPETDMSRPGMEPGPPRWEVSTLAKSYSNGTPTKRQVSKRQVKKKCLVSKRSVSKRQVYKTSGLQNIRFQNVWFQNVWFQILNFKYLLNKKYRDCQVCIHI
jgi:hypothetical protein